MTPYTAGMLCWLNGDMVEASDARISPFDRGFLFGDGVYEVVQYFNRVGVGLDLHIERLRRSLQSAGIEGFAAARMRSIGTVLLDAAGLHDAILYLQVSRGVQMPRAHLPAAGAPPTVFAYAVPAPSIEEFQSPRAISALLLPDERWHRCAVKSTSLIANVLAAMEGARQGAHEVILHRDGVITEGSMTNVFMVQAGRIATPPIAAEPSILAGVTRALAIEAGQVAGMPIEERRVAVAELRQADEVFITSTRRLIDAIVQLDGAPIGAGTPGPQTLAIFERLKALIAENCGSTLHSSA